MQLIASGDALPSEKIDQAIAGIAAFVREHAFFPAIMLREMAEGGVHLDRETLAALAKLPRTVAQIVQEGVRERAFRSIHPLAAYFTMVAPIVFYLAAAPIRTELTARHFDHMPALPTDAFVRHLQETMRIALAAPRSSPETAR